MAAVTAIVAPPLLAGFLGSSGYVPGFIAKRPTNVTTVRTIPNPTKHKAHFKRHPRQEVLPLSSL